MLDTRVVDLKGLTEEQYEAVYEHRANLAVVAGAGSGKTRVLVERFIELLRSTDWPLESLVAITFTEKAAREMRDRLRLAIEKEAARAADTADAPTRERWNALRASLDRTRISTIHSLCATLLRQFPAEAGVDPKFSVLEDVDASLLRQDAVATALAELQAEGGDELEILSYYGAATVADTMLALIGGGALAADIMKAVPESPEAIMARWLDLRDEIYYSLRDNLLADERWSDAAAWIRSEGADDPADRLEIVRANVESNLYLLESDRALEMRATLTGIKEIKLIGGSPKAWGGKERFDEAKANLKTLRVLAGMVLKKMGEEIGEADVTAARHLPLWRRLYSRCLAEYMKQKDARSALDFDDLEQRTRDLLENQPGAVEACRRQMRHVLVDEFQDTSAIQRDIVYRLAPPDAPGRLFVVGDPKQSIYRFRGADVSLFQRVVDDLTDRDGRELRLSASFRTHARLVAAFNDLFASVLGTVAREAYEAPLVQPMTAPRPSREDVGPVMELLLVPKEAVGIGAEDEEAEGDEAGPKKVTADACRRWQAHAVARRLREMVESGYPVWDKENSSRASYVYRPMRYDDVAILFQASTAFPIYEEVFKQVGLGFVTVAGRGYFKRQEVWDLLNLLKALDNPYDDLSLACALRSPLFALSDEALLALRQMTMPGRPHDTLPLIEALEASGTVPERDRDAVEFARQVVQTLHELAGRSPLVDLLNRALSETGFLATLSALPGGSRRRGNVEKLLDIARSTSGLSLADFIDRVQELRDQESREGEALVEAEGSVQMMTVHKAKGLEFPVVIIADASNSNEHAGVSGPRGRSIPLRSHPGLGLAAQVKDEQGKSKETAAWAWSKMLDEHMDRAEKRRLFYVAATRAQDCLMLAGQSSAPRPPADRDPRESASWMQLSLEALEYDPGEAIGPEDVVEEIVRDWGVIRLQRLAVWPERPEIPSTEEGQPVRGNGAREFPMAGPVPSNGAVLLPEPTATDLARIMQYLSPSPASELAETLAAAAELAVTGARTIYPAAPQGDRTHVPGRILGQLAHKALEQWRLPKRTPDLDRILENQAWNLGLTDERLIERAASQTMDLLRRFERSDLYREMTAAGTTRRHEVPFSVSIGERLVHGTIDALFRRPGGRWVVVDFKTEHVEGDREALQENVEADHITQLAIYAQAVTELVGQTPVVLLHYVRPGQTLLVPEADWQRQLKLLEAVTMVT